MGCRMRHFARQLAAVACAVALAACSATTGQEGTGDGAFVQGAGGVAFPVEEREPAPRVSGATIGGEELRLSDLDGPVLVNFWASWCGPCVTEAPHLVAIDEEYGPRGLHVVGVNVKDQPANARSFERDHGIGYPSWYDEAASIAASFGGIGPAALPSTILLDDEHRVAVRLFGAVTAMQLAPHLERLLEEADAS